MDLYEAHLQFLKITCSLNAPILKQYCGMFVTDATFQEWRKGGRNGFNGQLLRGMVKVSLIFLVNWVSRLQGIISGKNRMKDICRNV